MNTLNILHYRIDLPSVLGTTLRCNLKCEYCHKDYFPVNTLSSANGKIKFSDAICFLEEVFRNDTRKRKIHFTGRVEPLILKSDILEKELNEINLNFPDFEKTMTTNAYLLKNKARILHNNGIHRINISIHKDSLLSKNFLQGVESALKNGVDVCFNAVISKENLTTISDILYFTNLYDVKVKFFPILGLSCREVGRLLEEIDLILKQCELEKNTDSYKSRSVYCKADKVIAYLKYPADRRPDACYECFAFEQCLEGCWDSIRITPWYIKPCGVREDNVYFFIENNIEVLKNKLRSGGKLI